MANLVEQLRFIEVWYLQMSKLCLFICLLLEAGMDLVNTRKKSYSNQLLYILKFISKDILIEANILVKISAHFFNHHLFFANCMKNF